MAGHTVPHVPSPSHPSAPDGREARPPPPPRPPPNVVEGLTPEDRQAFADLRTEGDRRDRARRARRSAGEFPDFLAALENPAAAFLWLDLDEKAHGGAFDLALAVRLGAQRKLTPAAVAVVHDVLRRAEHIVDDGAGGYRLSAPWAPF